MRSVEEGRLAWQENTECLRGREGARRRSHIQERGHPFQVVGKPFRDRDILNICGLVVVVPTMPITASYYYFKRGSVELWTLFKMHAFSSR